MNAHWSDGHVEWLRRQFPELAATPIYIRAPEEVGLSPNSHCLASTGAYHAVRMCPALQAGGWWRGRGMAILFENVDHYLSTSWGEQLGLLVHETAHYFQDVNHAARRPESEWTELERLFGTGDEMKCLLQKFQIKLDDAAILKAHQGPEFLRPLLHIWFRTRREIELGDTLASSPLYGSPPRGDCLNALADELELRINGSIESIVRSPMPEEFSKLWSTA